MKGTNNMERKLYKSADEKVLAGVCGGIGEYFSVDPVVIRLLVVVFTIMGGAGLIAYIIAAIIIPEKNLNRPSVSDSYTYDNQESNSKDNGTVASKSGGGMLTLGIILVVLGGYVILKTFVPWIPRDLIFAVILIGLGLFFIAKKNK